LRDEESRTTSAAPEMSFLDFCRWIEKSPLGTGVRDSVWIFPVIESIHILGIVLLAFTASLVDLRLLGVGLLRRQPLAEVSRQLLPWAWGAIVLMIVTGALLFASEAASKCYESTAFYVKMALLALAIANAAFTYFAVNRHADQWDSTPPARTKILAVFSLAVWAGVVFAGRGIAYF
jgi:hypothetical protein